VYWTTSIIKFGQSLCNNVLFNIASDPIIIVHGTLHLVELYNFIRQQQWPNKYGKN